MLSFYSRIVNYIAAERERWIVWFPVALGVGIGLYFSVDKEWALYQVGSLLSLSLCGAWVSRYRVTSLMPWFIIVFCVTIGIALAWFQAWRYSDTVIVEDTTEVVWVRATLEEMEMRPYGQRIWINHLDLWQPETGKWSEKKTPTRARINVRTSMADEIMPGSRIAFKAVLSPPPARPVYPNGYYFAQSAYFDGIGAVGYTVSDIKPFSGKPVYSLSEGIAAWIAAIRQRVTYQLFSAVSGDTDTGHIMTALLTGGRGGISETTLEHMRQAGLGHILAISGLHMALVMTTLYVVIRGLLALIPAIALRYHIKKWSALAALTSGAMYLMLSGMPVSAQRAYIMAGLFFVAILLDRSGTPMRPIAWAAVVILVLDPFALVQPGFQMSFAAVVALVACFEWMRERRPPYMQVGTGQKIVFYIGGVLGSSLIAGMATAPFGLYHFGTAAHYGILANLIAIPLLSFWIMPWGIIALLLLPLGLHSLPLALMQQGIETMVSWAEFIAGLEYATGYVPQLPSWFIGVLALSGLWFCLWRCRWRWWGVGAMILTVMVVPFFIEKPHIILDEEGELFALRQEDGLLAFSSLRSRYVKEQWLRANGEKEAVRLDEVADGWINCTEEYCRYRDEVVIIRSGEAKPSCDHIRLLVNLSEHPFESCDVEKTITRRELGEFGTHTITLGEEITVRRVADELGERFWTR